MGFAVTEAKACLKGMLSTSNDLRCSSIMFALN